VEILYLTANRLSVLNRKSGWLDNNMAATSHG